MPRISGRKEAVERLNRLSGREKIELVGQALFTAADEIKAYAQHSITDGSVSGAAHVVSKPGEPPNADLHILDRSIEAARTGPLSAEVSANAAHAVPLERGTSKMAERPFMGPAARAKKKRVVELVTNAVNIATRRK